MTAGDGRACLVGKKEETGNDGGGGFWYGAAAAFTAGLGCCDGLGMFASIDEAGSIND